MTLAMVTVVNTLGLHARPAAKVVDCAARYASDIKLIYNETEVDAKSIMSVLLLAAPAVSLLWLSSYHSASALLPLEFYLAPVPFAAAELDDDEPPPLAMIGLTGSGLPPILAFIGTPLGCALGAIVDIIWFL